MNSKEQSKIINSIGSPKLREFRNENAAMCRPSSLQFRHSYIIKNLVRRLSQPMIARPIKTARSLQILHEIGQIPPHQRSGRELPPRFIVQECFNWSNADMWRVTWIISEFVKVEERHKTLMQGQWMHSNWIRKKAKSIKCDNNKEQKNTQLLAAGRNDSPMS